MNVNGLTKNVVLNCKRRAMTLIPKAKWSAAGSAAGAPASWEVRSTRRVLETRRDQTLARSRRLVEAAYELLETEGLEGLTIRAVLKRTGLSRRAFYERFSDKDELVLAVFEESLRLAGERYSEQVRALADPMERLKLILTSLVLGKSGRQQSGRRGAALSREHLRLAESRPDDLQAALSPLINVIAKQLAAAMQAGSVRQDDPQRLAVLVYNLVSTTVHTELLTEKGGQPDWKRRGQLAADLWEFCRRAIAA